MQLSDDVRRMLLEERRSKVTLTQNIEQDLLSQILEQKKKASWFSTNYNEALTLNQDIKRFYHQLETVENRINFIELESQAPGYLMRWILNRHCSSLGFAYSVPVGILRRYASGPNSGIRMSLLPASAKMSPMNLRPAIY